MARPSKPADYGVEAGTVLLGKYRVDAILGHGGMGVVAQCTHLGLEERVAVKFLRDDVTLDEETMRRFLREAQNAVKLKSEHVARVSDVGTFESGTPYMVMEYLEGIDLGQMLEESGKINPSLAVELLIQACVALAEAHSLGIVHRDIKPGNLFVTWRADGSPLLKILDFGISKAPVGGDMNLTQTQSLLGTPAYMSPEQMRSARSVDPRSDIWSLGTVLYEIIQGRRPFEAESFSEMCVKVAVDPPSALTVPHPAGLEKVILRALEKKAEERYQTIAEMARDLVPFARDRNGALVAVERMTRMLGRSRPGFGREEMPSPEAAPRGMLRDAKSQPIAAPRLTNDTSPAPSLGGNTPKFDSGVLLVGDATEVVDRATLGGERTSITVLDPVDEGTRTKLTAIHEDSDDTAERKRRTTDGPGHTTIEEEVGWQGNWSPTPQSTTAQPGPTTDPSMPPAELPPESTAEVVAAAEAQAEANAAAAAQAHAAAKVLAAQKAKAQAAAATAAATTPRPGGGTIPQTPSIPSAAKAPLLGPTTPSTASAAIATKDAGGRGPQNAPPPAQLGPAQGIGATLPGLFPMAIPRGAIANAGANATASAGTPGGSAAGSGTATGASALGSSPVITTAAGKNPRLLAVSARPTGPVVDLRPSRGRWILVVGLVLGLAIGATLYIAQRDDDGTAPATPSLPSTATGSATTTPTPTPITPAPPIGPQTGTAAVPAANTTDSAASAAEDGKSSLPAKSAAVPSTPTSAGTTVKTGADRGKTGTGTGKTGTRPKTATGTGKGGKGERDKSERDKSDDRPPDTTPPKTGKPADVFGVRDPTKPHK